MAFVSNVQKALSQLSLIVQSIRTKTRLHPSRTNWKPIPPNWDRGSYYIDAARVINWRKPLIEFQKKQTENEGEPPAPPAKLHVVTRVKALRHEPKVNKEMCSYFNIHDRMHVPAIIANTPSNNSKLMTIKHLIRIKALRTPQGLPEQLSEMYSTQLRTNGTLDVIKSLRAPPSTESLPAEPTRLITQKTIRQYNRRKVDQHRVLAEYQRTEYNYRYNQDGKERPYKANVGD